MIPLVKTFFQKTPRPVGAILSKIPYRMRPGIGAAYARHKRLISAFDAMDTASQKAFILSRMQKVVAQAMNVPFYRELYKSCGVSPNDIRNFSDISRLPVVTKEMLREAQLANRSQPVTGRYLANTGGSSGSPLNFYITPGHIPIEWAHMHTIWEKLGYDQSRLKLVFAGRNLARKAVEYDGLRHSYAVNVYKGIDRILPELAALLDKEKIFYLHGYPSALAVFAENLAQYAPDLVQELQSTLRGIFLGSEYPAPMYRDRIESVFNVPSVSWYGHTERAVLAWERKEPFIYHPFQTYGYCEVAPNEESGGWRLIGTSYSNFASPFIRYDTGDDVEPVDIQEGLLKSFRIREGRRGEYVIDRNGVKIPLTALIFGRHHPMFDVAKFIQVRQVRNGEITIMVTPKAELPSDFVFEDWFDSEGLDMKINYEVLEKPVLSTSGKVVLKADPCEGEV